MIEPVSEHNLEDILPLIRQYQEFYGIEDINDERNRLFFAQFGQFCESGCQFLFRDDERNPVAFATVYFSYVSSIPAKVGVMSDLYTVPSHRGNGIGRTLINHCQDYALSKGAVRLQWFTAEDNHKAQKLYDAIGEDRGMWKVYTCASS